jgi:hypothetical protein
VTLRSRAGDERDIELEQLMDNLSIRIFTVTADEGLIFTVASENGQVWMSDVTEIEVS